MHLAYFTSVVLFGSQPRKNRELHLLERGCFSLFLFIFHLAAALYPFSWLDTSKLAGSHLMTLQVIKVSYSHMCHAVRLVLLEKPSAPKSSSILQTSSPLHVKVFFFNRVWVQSLLHQTNVVQVNMINVYVHLIS